jgi:His-Xaa-Ser system protein HxsD
MADGDPDDTFLLVDGSVYPREAVLRACYWLAEKAVFAVSELEPGHLRIDFVPNSAHDSFRVREELQTALVDFALRVSLEANTADLRRLIWQSAFAEALGPKT